MQRIRLFFLVLLSVAGGTLAMPSLALDHGSNSCFAHCVSTLNYEANPLKTCYQLSTPSDRQDCLNSVKQKANEICENGCLEDPNYLQSSSTLPAPAPQTNHDNPTLYPAQPQPRINYQTAPTPVRAIPKSNSVTGDRG